MSPEEWRAYRRAYMRRYRAAHPERIRAIKRDWYARHGHEPEQVAKNTANVNRWRKANAERARSIASAQNERRRRARLEAAG